MKHRVALIEFPIFDQFPLISGYLHSFSEVDPAIAAAFEFVYYQKEVTKVDYAATLRAIKELRARIVCMSAYVWNVGLVRRVVADLQDDPHVQHIVLGGHQISHHLERYIDRRDSKTIVINGQGEIPFRALLRHLSVARAPAQLKGLSFYNEGELWNGGEADMLLNLEELPSPYLNGQFDRMQYPVATYETNRGCPYRCTFCTWGGDTTRVAKFSLERVKEELLWLAKRSVLFIYIADANWGMLARDIEISEYIAQLKTSLGSPWGVYYAAAKNKPKGSIACIEKFHKAGVMASQAIGVQSLDTTTLSLIDRTNIKTSAFIEMFRQLGELGIDSFCELIWPLPGETLESLKRGFEQLLELGARTTIMYPAILINNARLTTQSAEFGLEYLDGDDWMSELKTVKATKFADRRAVEAGLWFYYSYFLLGNFDYHKAILRYTHHTQDKAYAEIVTDFAQRLRETTSTSAYATTLADIFAHEAHGTFLTIGRLATHLGHEARSAAIQDVGRFIFKPRSCAQAPRDLAMLALWSFYFPKLFVDSDDGMDALVEFLDELGSAHGTSFSQLASVRREGPSIVLAVDDSTGIWSEVAAYFGVTARGTITQIEVRHPRTTFVPYDTDDATRNFQYAGGMIERLSQLVAEICVSVQGAAGCGAAPRLEATAH